MHAIRNFGEMIAGSRLLLLCWVGASLCFSTVAFAAAPIASYTDSDGRRVYRTATEQRKDSPAKVASVKAVSVRADRMAARPAEQLKQLVDDAARENSLDPALVMAVVEVESAGNTFAVSRKGAMGLMQLMPSTATRLNVSNAFDPQQNIRAGSQHLRSLIERFDGNLSLALAAYNAGEERVSRRWKVPDIPETIQYVSRVLSRYKSRGEHTIQNSVVIYRSETGGIVSYTKS